MQATLSPRRVPSRASNTKTREDPIKEKPFRRRDWHIALLRSSLIRAVYQTHSHHQIRSNFSRKIGRSIGRQTSFRKGLIQTYGQQGEYLNIANCHLWNMALNGWEPNVRGRRMAGLPELDTQGATQEELEGSLLQAAHIVPQCFGTKMFRRIFGDAYHDEDFWAPSNGLLLPRGVAEAMDDWSITVVPENDNSSYPIRDFKFRVIDPTDERLNRRITFVKGDYRTGRDLDGARLFFPKSFRPKLNYLYFNHCCAIIKKNRHLFHDSATDGIFLKARKAEQERTQAEGREIWQAPFTQEYDLYEYWKRMLRDLARLDQHPHRTVVDWSMDLRYLVRSSSVQTMQQQGRPNWGVFLR
ncbi:uncharacterized protein N0V89_012616 [Didymosphaeria variabile]|uniref:HNH nuclease domain-containing protein n=1 Tax=Didymosphaeria variabile TaxID=1932322 RepID=A0A9W8XAW1_9PLEO|nr:uncharacterized protein N0V89_012616 [Didymosphaeria variabile]KAJ4344872.1 hypothetical protein N0V89_012616 [Didymosphaeria variabile]